MSDPRAALRNRQGPGARYDAPEAPAAALLQARRGAAYLARVLNALNDADLADPGLSGQSRARTLAALSYQARAMAQALERLHKGPQAMPMMSVQARRSQTHLGATLPPHALRALYAHTVVHLDVTFRDLPGTLWTQLLDWDDEDMPVARLPQIRAQALWAVALDLDAGGRASDVPVDLRAAVEELSVAQIWGTP